MCLFQSADNLSSLEEFNFFETEEHSSAAFDETIKYSLGIEDFNLHCTFDPFSEEAQFAAAEVIMKRNEDKLEKKTKRNTKLTNSHIRPPLELEPTPVKRVLYEKDSIKQDNA